MWRLRFYLKGLGVRLIRGGETRAKATQLTLLHQEILRLERRVEILEAERGIEVADSKERI